MACDRFGVFYLFLILCHLNHSASSQEESPHHDDGDTETVQVNLHSIQSGDEYYFEVISTNLNKPQGQLFVLTLYKQADRENINNLIGINGNGQVNITSEMDNCFVAEGTANWKDRVASAIVCLTTDAHHQTKVLLTTFVEHETFLLDIRPSMSPYAAANEHLLTRHKRRNKTKLPFGNNPTTPKHRFRRDVVDDDAKDTKNCGLMIIVDSSFFQLMNNSRLKTIHHIMSTYHLADAIFRNTYWWKLGTDVDREDNDYIDPFGLLICKVMIIEDSSQDFESKYEFNQIRKWNGSDLLHSLNRTGHGDDEKWNAVHCLVHLFTANKLVRTEHGQESVVHGLAFEDSAFNSSVNVGITSFNTADPYQLRHVVTFAHELAHGFGARHDVESLPDSAENCLPIENGTYIMSGSIEDFGPNNFKFSPCTIRAVYQKLGPNLQNFIPGCNKCGNDIVEATEECDDPKSPCCLPNCKFAEKAVCIPSNPTNPHSLKSFGGTCCTDACQLKAKGSRCAPADLDYCLAEASCDGEHAHCARDHMSDGEVCANNGTCFGGYCKRECPRHKTKCQCGAKHICYVCCRKKSEDNRDSDDGDGEGCRPEFPLTNVTVFDGQQHGTCIDGQFQPNEFSISGLQPTQPSLPPDSVSPAEEDDHVDTYTFNDLWNEYKIVIIVVTLTSVFAIILCVTRYRNRKYGQYQLPANEVYQTSS